MKWPNTAPISAFQFPFIFLDCMTSRYGSQAPVERCDEPDRRECMKEVDSVSVADIAAIFGVNRWNVIRFPIQYEWK